MKILLADDHAIVRQGFSSLLSSVFEDATVVNVKNSQQAMQALRADEFDLVILDINLEQSSGLTFAEHALQRWESLKILMFSMFDDISIIDRAMKIGAMGYVCKQSEPEALIAAVQAISKGQKYLEHKTAIELATYQLTQSDGLSDLTQRELDIFLGVAKGLTRTSIAEELSVSEKTVSNTITLLKRKLNLNTNTEFVHFAIRQGYIKVAS